MKLALSRMSSRAVLPHTRRLALRQTSAPWRRCFSPTSATDSRHVHPWTGRLPSRHRFLGVDRPRGAAGRRPSGPSKPAPGRPCGLPSPRRAGALTAPSRLRTVRPACPPRGGLGVLDAPVPRRCRPRARPVNGPLTLPVAPRAARLPGSPTAPRVVPVGDASTPPTLPTRSAFHRQMLPLRGNPPPIQRLCRRLPGFRRSFAPPVLSHGNARPNDDPRAHHPRRARPRAACRLLQPIRSASTTPDRLNPADPTSGRPPARPLAAGGLRRPCGRPANRDVTGQGPLAAFTAAGVLPP
jgi:hypothetical protein